MSAALAALVAAALAAGPAPDSVPFEAVYGVRTLAANSGLAISHAGDRLAYADVRLKPEERAYEGAHHANGVPARNLNSELFVADLKTGAKHQVCAGRFSWSPVWSPDDQRLAYYAESDGAPRLWVYDLNSGTCRQVSSAVIKASALPGGQIIWSADGRTLYAPLDPRPDQDHTWEAIHEAFARKAPPGPGKPKVSVLRTEAATTAPNLAQESNDFFQQANASLAAIDVETGAVRVIAPAAAIVPPSLMKVSPSGGWVVYGAPNRPADASSGRYLSDLGAVRIGGGEVIALARDVDSSDVPADRQQAVYRWAPSADRLVYFKAGQLWASDFTAAGPGAARRLAPGIDRLSSLICEFVQDGASVVTAEGSNASGVMNLVIAPLDGGAARRIPWDNATWDLRDMVRTSAGRAWQPSSSTIVLRARHRATGEDAYLRLDLQTGRTEVVWKGRGVLDRLTASDRGDVLVGAYTDLETSPTLNRYSADLKGVRRIAVVEPKLDGLIVGPAERFETTVPMHDGTLQKLSSALLLPPGAKRGDRLPAIVMIYPGDDLSKTARQFGGGMGNSSPNLIFTSRGYAVLQMNLPIAPPGKASDPLQDMTDLLLPQIQRAADLGYIDINRLVLSGQSYGGYSTFGIVTRTRLFRGAIPVNGFTDLAAIYGESDSEFGRRTMESGQFRLGAPPWSDLKRYIDNSPYLQLDKIRTPLLIVVGRADSSLRDAKKMFNGLRRLGRPVELAVYDDEPHAIMNWSPVNAADASARMIGFLEATIGPGWILPTRRTAADIH